MIDTAEMYADGGAEELVGEALAARRDEAFLVDKVLPSDAVPPRHRRGLRAGPAPAAHRPDRPLVCCTGAAGTPLAETVEAFVEPREPEMRARGVSNLDAATT